MAKVRFFLDSNLYLYVFFPNIQKSSKIQSTLEGEVTIATYALSKKPFDHKVISAVPSSHPAPPKFIRWVGIPSQDAGREDCILGVVQPKSFC